MNQCCLIGMRTELRASLLQELGSVPVVDTSDKFQVGSTYGRLENRKKEYSCAVQTSSHLHNKQGFGNSYIS